jgi:hypothetical protein
VSANALHGGKGIVIYVGPMDGRTDRMEVKSTATATAIAIAMQKRVNVGNIDGQGDAAKHHSATRHVTQHTHISTKSQDNTKTSRKHRTKEQVSSIQQPRICNSIYTTKKRRS